jgi:CheY-like chemotaxis protein
MVIIKAENGKYALEALVNHPDIDLVLMDIMMPEMDGYEAMRQIRSQKKHQGLPVIALTAKAMNNDKQKCIDAGANDYIAKPIDVERLLSLMRVWMSK